jgi:hypothetical protein
MSNPNPILQPGAFSPSLFSHLGLKLFWKIANRQIRSLWDASQLLRFFNDLFALVYLFQFAQFQGASAALYPFYTWWYLFFILNSSQLSFILWNVVSTYLPRRCLRSHLRQIFSTWNRLLFRCPVRAKEPDEVEVEVFDLETLWEDLQGNSLNHKEHFLAVLRFLAFQYGVFPSLRTWFRIVGGWILLPLYFSLLCPTQTELWWLSGCLWMQIASWLKIQRILFHSYETLLVGLDELWNRYQASAFAFRTLCQNYAHLPVRDVEVDHLYPKGYVMEVLRMCKSDVSHLILEYLGTEIGFENWVEMPIDKTHMIGWIYQNHELLRCTLERTHPKRMVWKRLLRGPGYSVLPD